MGSWLLHTPPEAFCGLYQSEVVGAGAKFDRSGAYRYELWREWDPSRGRVHFVMLNPSTADAASDDPTIRRCIGFARTWGFGGIVVTNLFALRSTDPSRLSVHPDPVGPENDDYIARAADSARMNVVAWGNLGSLRARSTRAYRLLGGRTNCLGVTNSGQPRHPLYVNGATRYEPYTPPT